MTASPATDVGLDVLHLRTEVMNPLLAGREPCEVRPVFDWPDATLVLPAETQATPRPLNAREATVYRLARGLDVPPELLGLPAVVDAPHMDAAVAAVLPEDVAVPRAWTPGPVRHDTCRAPIAGDPFRRCMLRTAHDAGCLPVPGGRGLAVR